MRIKIPILITSIMILRPVFPTTRNYIPNAALLLNLALIASFISISILISKSKMNWKSILYLVSGSLYFVVSHRLMMRYMSGFFSTEMSDKLGKGILMGPFKDLLAEFLFILWIDLMLLVLLRAMRLLISNSVPWVTSD
jgi:hypothetical protein